MMRETARLHTWGRGGSGWGHAAGPVGGCRVRWDPGWLSGHQGWGLSGAHPIPRGLCPHCKGERQLGVAAQLTEVGLEDGRKDGEVLDGAVGQGVSPPWDVQSPGTSRPCHVHGVPSACPHKMVKGIQS